MAKRRHDAPVLVATLLLPAALATDAAARPGGPARAVLSVGATVVRSPPAADVTVRGGVVLVRNPGGIGVTVEGGVARAAPGATLRIEPSRSGVTRITLTY